MKLVRMNLDFGRMGTVQSLFICEHEELTGLYGKWADFGSILGKNSEVTCMLDDGDFEILKVSNETVLDIFHNVGCSISGPNPLYYVEP